MSPFLGSLHIPASSHQDKFAVVDTRSKYFKSCHVASFQDPARSSFFISKRGVFHVFIRFEDIFKRDYAGRRIIILQCTHR